MDSWLREIRLRAEPGDLVTATIQMREGGFLVSFRVLRGGGGELLSSEARATEVDQAVNSAAEGLCQHFLSEGLPRAS